MVGAIKALVSTLGVMFLFAMTFFGIAKNVSISETRGNPQYVYGDRIYDEDGSETVWRGVGGSYLFHAGENYQEAWRQHISEMQASGFNTVRLAFAFDDSTPEPERGTPSADILDFDKMDWVLDFLGKHGMKGILDLHNWRDMQGDFGSQKLIDNWRAIAKKYGGDNRVAAYELFNEPGSPTWASSVKSKVDVVTVYRELTNSIRDIDPSHIVIWQSEPYIPPLDGFQGEIPANVVFTAHRWWTNKTWVFDIWTPENLSYITVGYLTNMRQKLNVPFWLGEFGSGSPFNSSNAQWLLTQHNILRCEEQVIGWNLWMGRTCIDDSWEDNLGVLPANSHIQNMVRKDWQFPLLKLTDFVEEYCGVDRFEPYRIEMWHNNDFVTFRPGIVILVVVSHRSGDGSLEITNKERILVSGHLTIQNGEHAEQYPDDWNITVYSVPPVSGE